MQTSSNIQLSGKQAEKVVRPSNSKISTRHETLLFYLDNHLVSEVQGEMQRSFFQHGEQLLAQKETEFDISSTALLACDLQRSVLITSHPECHMARTYTAYGHRLPGDRLNTLLGFNGERHDWATGNYLLGNGYRAFNPVTQRFNAPDSWSPFGRGGTNAYVYCLGDPVNRDDRTGHFSIGSVFKNLRRLVGFKFNGRKKMAGTGSSANPENSPSAFQFLKSDKATLVGFHGTSDRGATGILSKGVLSDSQGDSFFVTNSFANAEEYASLQKKGAVLAVYTNDFEKLHSFSTRGLVKQSNIEQLKIPKAAHGSLRFERVSTAIVSSNFNRFMSEQESAAYWINEFRKK